MISAENKMISDENKLKLITGEKAYLTSPDDSGYFPHIWVRHVNKAMTRFIHIIDCDSDSFNNGSRIYLWFEQPKNYVFDYFHIDHTFMNGGKLIFDSAYSLERYNNFLSPNGRAEILEYCNWIVSEEAQDFIRRIKRIKAFM
jgi:hypothetical protein